LTPIGVIAADAILLQKVCYLLLPALAGFGIEARLIKHVVSADITGVQPFSSCVQGLLMNTIPPDHPVGKNSCREGLDCSSG
jgi:hypothetical protein